MVAAPVKGFPPARVDVIVAGGGPCGLMLANELGRRGVRAIVIDDKPGTAFNPQANATQARTMEHFRRLGFADEVRALGMPPDFPTDVAYFTRYATHELARFRLPSSREARQKVASLGGSWSAAELPHRVSQKFVETVLRRHAQALPGISLHYGWRLLSFRESGDGVSAEIECLADGRRCELQGAYLVGADGPRSTVRQQLGWRYEGETGVQRDFMGGRMLAVYLRSSAFYEAVRHSPAWMNVSFNRERRAFMAAVDGRGEFAFHTQLRAGEREQDVNEAHGKAMFHAAVGAELPLEVLSCRAWTAGHCLVAERFQQGRVFLAGDAAHLFTPTGGLGYNTAVDDAVNLGWKLAAVLRGHAGADLLASYEHERRPLAQRNTGYARGFAESIGRFEPAICIEDETPQGQAAREHAGAYLADHGRREFNIPGITFGARYDGSPAIVGDGSTPPADAADRYTPSACPGGRAPHLWLEEGVSLYDRFGFEWTVLQLAGDGSSDAWRDAARRRGLPLEVLRLDNDEARELYAADLVLIRPDQVVAWRGDDRTDPETVLQRLLGAPAQGELQ
jgi:2-polyprenyl-6-methoxyphenol hydroxylase-like FAD-dependent oxidoreductase